MRKWLLFVLMALSVAVLPAFCDEEEDSIDEGDQIEIQERQLDLDAQRAEIAFDNEMKKLDIEERRAMLQRGNDEHGRRHGCGRMVPFLAMCIIVHILLAVWVYGDMRKRNAGSGIWIVIVLMTGLFGGLVYAVVRLGDGKIQAG